MLKLEVDGVVGCWLRGSYRGLKGLESGGVKGSSGDLGRAESSAMWWRVRIGGYGVLEWSFLLLVADRGSGFVQNMERVGVCASMVGSGTAIRKVVLDMTEQTRSMLCTLEAATFQRDMRLFRTLSGSR